MAIVKCKMCGGELTIVPDSTICECEYCGSKQTVPNTDDEKRLKLYERANKLRFSCEFDKAAGVYESIVSEYQDEAEAYWGLVLCKYGIEYVDDPKTGKKIPTCHRSSFDSIMDDSDFELVMENSDAVARRVYREEAKQIEELRKSIVEVSSKEEPYDIFICYKETADDGQRTVDSVIAQDVYEALVEKGYKVFFSRITLEDKLGQEYEPYIFSALNSARVMLVFGTDYEYYNAVWVKNEWSRFLQLMESGQKKTLIPCFKDIDAYDMPKEFAKLQAQDMGKVGAIQDLLRGIGKIIGSKSGSSVNVMSGAISAEGSALTQRGNMALEDGDFEGAEGYFERALDANPSDARAYLGKFLAFNCLTSLDDLDDKVCLLEDNKEYKRAEQFADPELAKQLKEVRNANEMKIQRLRVFDVIRKVTEKKTIKESLRLLAQGTEESYNQVLALFDTLEEGRHIKHSKSKYYKRMAQSQFYILNFLHNCLDVRSYTEISLAVRDHGIVFKTDSLDQLVEFGFVNQYPEGYCWPGAKEEKERILREQEERRQREARQKAAYDEECASVNRQIQEKIDIKVGQLSEEYDSRLRGIQHEIDEEVSECNKQRDNLERQISDWRSQLSSLGFFKGKEKKTLQAQIDEAQNRLNAIPIQQQIREKHQHAINQVNIDKKAEIDRISAEVKSKYSMPMLEDFAEVAKEKK